MRHAASVFIPRLCLALALCLAVPPALARAQDPHALEKLQEFVTNNQKLSFAKMDELTRIIDFLNQNGVPCYQWNSQVDVLQVEPLVYLKAPTCRGSSPGSGPVVAINTGYAFPSQITDMYVFGMVEGTIHFIGGGILETPEVSGNVFAGKLRPGEGRCYAQTTIGLWSHEIRDEFLVPQSGYPSIPGKNVFFVIADDFRNAPEGAHAEFQRMFNALTAL